MFIDKSQYYKYWEWSRQKNWHIGTILKTTNIPSFQGMQIVNILHVLPAMNDLKTYVYFQIITPVYYHKY